MGRYDELRVFFRPDPGDLAFRHREHDGHLSPRRPRQAIAAIRFPFLGFMRLMHVPPKDAQAALERAILDLRLLLRKDRVAHTQVSAEDPIRNRG